MFKFKLIKEILENYHLNFVVLKNSKGGKING